MSNADPVAAPVAVAISDRDSDDLLAFARAEARWYGCGIRLVGDDAEVLHELADEITDVPVETRIEDPGTPHRLVLNANGDARLAVVRHRDLLHLVHALTHPEGAPQSWSDPPVACMPAAWQELEDDDRPISVGIEHPDDATMTTYLLEGATRLARGAEVRTVHSCHRDAVANLLEAAAGSRLLVLGRNEVDEHGGTRLGRTARAVLHDSPCPVVLLPPTPPAPGSDHAEPIPRPRRGSGYSSPTASSSSWVPGRGAQGSSRAGRTTINRSPRASWVTTGSK